MDLTPLQKFVEEEVAALGQGYPQPIEDDPSEDEEDEAEKLGEVPEDLRPFVGRIQELTDQARALKEEQEAKCAAETCTEEGHAETKAKLMLLLERKNYLREIFWLLLKKRLGISGISIGLRAGWQVVACDDEEKPAVRIIAIGQPLFGGQEGGFGSLFGR